jgi:hypothetical protein
MSVLQQSDLDHFQTFGGIRVPGAFSAVAAAAMCDAIWDALAETGVRRDDPSTWTKTRRKTCST